MIVTPSGVPAATSTEALDSKAKADLNYDSFLKLLIATMQNQDPTKPNDPAETLSQLAAFSTVEQNIKLNTKLDSLLTLSTLGESASLIGKTITKLDGTVTGIAESVEASAAGTFVILDNGARLSLSDGLRIA